LNILGYGIHLSCNANWRGLHIEDIEPDSPAESAGLSRGDIILAVNGHSIENKDFFLIFSFIQQELKQSQIRFLVLDPHSAELAQRYQLNIDENHENCIRTETSKYIKSSNKSDRTLAQNMSRDELDDINKLFSDLGKFIIMTTEYLRIVSKTKMN
jgi:predicted metalloprotease with PDZ domain